jgi:hypothetical protein
MLFKPGQDIYISVFNGKALEPMVVADYDKEGIVHCWNLRYEAGFVTPMQSKAKIPRFDGEKEITSLPAYPTNFHPDDAALRSRLIERGKKYWNLCEPSYQEHTGQTLRRDWHHFSPIDRSKIEVSTTTVCNSISEYGLLGMER